MARAMRIGQGIDVHRFSDDPARALVLGLVRVPDGPGLVGHSDADAATHALCDALLGAINQGDLGRHFPDHDPAFRDADSRDLLRHCVGLVADAGYRVVNADVTIVAERPKLALYMPAMSHELSTVVGAVVSVKATTAEGLGALGRAEGVGALAICLLEEAR
jgi:2-C-methyl-D-erythritol 2,4-cyclodiphosphate synthase